MIRFDHVTKRYNTNIGLDDVSVQIDRGDFVFLVGPSGAGKSTFVKLILKEIDADEGSITVKGREVTTMSNRMVPVHRRNIGIVFQDFRLLPNKTVYENVAFAMEITHHNKRSIRTKVPQALALMGISSYADKYPNELSAGEQQRVAIARAIVNKPTVLIADEPTGNLDPVTAWEIMKLLDQINKRGTTIVMVTHAKDIVDRMQKRVLTIQDGKIVRDEYGAYAKRRRGVRLTEEDEVDWETDAADLEDDMDEYTAREEAALAADSEQKAAMDTVDPETTDSDDDTWKGPVTGIFGNNADKHDLGVDAEEVFTRVERRLKND